MNEYLVAVIIGIVEGLTEFLPVSSTAHIRFCQELLALEMASEYWKMFAIVIQLGAILAVVVFFRERLGSFVSRTTDRTNQDKRSHHPLIMVMVGFLVTAIPCLLIDKWVGNNLESLPLMAWSLIVGGIAMAVIDSRFGSRSSTERLEDMSLMQAVVIGLFQILAAAFPGTSRSMATIAGGQIMGLSRPAALEFSFLLSIPIMVAATAFKLVSFVTQSTTAIDVHQWSVLLTGFVTSFLVAWVVIAWFMQWVRSHGFLAFSVYRIIVGIAVLSWLV